RAAGSYPVGSWFESRWAHHWSRTPVSELKTLVHLQEFDTKIAALETEAVRLPKQIETIHTAVAEAKKAVETVKARLDGARKDLRARGPGGGRGQEGGGNGEGAARRRPEGPERG